MNEETMKKLKAEISAREKKVSELQEQIVKAEKQQDAGQMVLLEKQIEAEQRVLSDLNRTIGVLTWKKPEMSAVQMLASGLDKYLTTKAEKVAEAEQKVKDTAKELKQMEKLLHEAMERGNVESVVDYSRKKADLQECLRYVQQMADHVKVQRTFPDGTLGEEWLRICESVRPDFLLYAQRVQALAAEYRKAVDELIGMKETLLQTRRYIKRIGEEHGADVSFYPVITPGIDTSWMLISKADGIKAVQVTSSNIREPAL